MAVPVAVIGATGYTGGELLRLLLNHPRARVAYAASRRDAGRPVADVQPHLAGWLDLPLEPIDPDAIAARCQVAFTAVPRGAAMDLAADLVARGVRVIDLGTDFRFRDPELYKAWYGLEHTRPELLAEAVYGLPELYRESLAAARVVGNPGCYPTAALLAMAPAVASGLADGSQATVAAISGASGAGREARDMYHLPHATESVQAYGIPGHRHTPEMEQGLAHVGGGPARVCFTPQLAPMSRGIMATCFLTARPGVSASRLQEAYEAYYRDEPFVRVLPPGELPQTKAVLGSNRCDVAVRLDERTGRVIALAAIDNLVKGAAGQAIQNLNVMMGWDETDGLRLAGLYP